MLNMTIIINIINKLNLGNLHSSEILTDVCLDFGHLPSSLLSSLDRYIANIKYIFTQLVEADPKCQKSGQFEIWTRWDFRHLLN